MQTEADCTFWDTVPGYFLADDRSNPSRAIAAGIIQREVEAGAWFMLEIGPCLGFDYEDHLRRIHKLTYTGYEGSATCCQNLERRFGAGIFQHKTFKDLQRLSFDIIYTKATLEHQPDFQYALNQMLMAAKRLVLINWYRPPAEVPITEFNTKIQLHSNTYKKADVVAAILATGRKLEIREVPKSTNVLYLIHS